MSKVFKIELGTEEETIEGKKIKDSIEERVALFNDNLLMNKIDKSKISEYKYALEKKMIESVRDGEKAILKQLLENAINEKENKKIETFNMISDTIDQINNLKESFIILTEDDLKKIVDSFESLEIKHPLFLRFRNLFKQLAKPTEFKIQDIRNNENKPEDKK